MATPQKRHREPEIHFYEWRMLAWFASETRDRLDATGRGIYRELLDVCYSQGTFPDDQDWICRRCACTPEQYAETWPKIQKHFPKVKKVGHRKNNIATIFRKRYALYINSQRNRRKTGSEKSNDLSSLDMVAPGQPNSRTELASTKLSVAKLSETKLPQWAPGSEPFEEFKKIFKGPKPENCWRVFASEVSTPERLATLFANTPLWMQVGKYRGGYVDANQYLRSGVWLEAPSPELLAEARASPWKSQEPHISATEEMT